MNRVNRSGSEGQSSEIVSQGAPLTVDKIHEERDGQALHQAIAAVDE